MPSGSKPLPTLGDLEIELLELLWRMREADVTESHAKIGERRGITPNTVGSALQRLFKKDLVVRHKVSHAYRYRARLGRAEFAARKVLEAVGGTKSLRDHGILSALVDLVADVDDTALDRLEVLIAAKRGKRGGG